MLTVDVDDGMMLLFGCMRHLLQGRSQDGLMGRWACKPLRALPGFYRLRVMINYRTRQTVSPTSLLEYHLQHRGGLVHLVCAVGGQRDDLGLLMATTGDLAGTLRRLRRELLRVRFPKPLRDTE